MIEIKFKPQELELSVTGHSGAAEKGKDIVCSAVSALFYALVQSVIESSEQLEEPPEIVIEDGNGLVSCKPKEGFLPTLQRTYWTILNGYELLAAEYNEYINFTFSEEDEK